MAICQVCNREMKTALGCTAERDQLPDGTEWDRLPYMADELGRETCSDCGAHVGGFHHGTAQCDQEKCPRCGNQLLMCVVLEQCRSIDRD